MGKKSSDPFEALLKSTETKNVYSAPVGLIETSGRYRIGTPARPNIKHDNGHLDMYALQQPTLADRAQLLKWKGMLNASEALCDARSGQHIDKCNGEDLSDANGAYRHFLYGNGADRTIDYERYIKGDPSGRELISKLTADFQKHAAIIGKDRVQFSVTSEAFTVGHGGMAPYPATANWQKTLGAHFIWVSADVIVSANSKGIIVFDASVTIHVEDRYNFNPGSTDVATGIPDSANGRFEITGLAKQYTNYATIARHVKWDENSQSSKNGAQE
jgi:hypothetical protein